jgi:cysteine desulfurase
MPLAKIAREAMLPFLGEQFGNPSSMHRPGRTAHTALAAARADLAELMKVSPEEIYFTPSGTHSNNTVLMGRARYCQANGLGRHSITTDFEHSSVSRVLDFLERSHGWRVTRLAPMVGSNAITADQIMNAIASDTTIVSVVSADSYTGSLQPVNEIAELALERKIFFHTDAALLPGRQSVEVSSGVQALSLSGHKFGGPKGSGALFIRRGNSLMPAVFGGGQEMGYFPGTERLADIVGLGAAAREVCFETKSTEQQSKLKTLQLSFVQAIAQQLQDNWRLVGSADLSKRLAGHVSLRLAEKTAARDNLTALIEQLADENIIVGSMDDALLVQFDKQHTEDDLHRLIDALKRIRGS